MSATDFGDPTQTICIPARELTGTREAKLAELDTLLAQLHLVRLVLCGQPVRLAGAGGAPDDKGRNRGKSRVLRWALRRVRAIVKPRRSSGGVLWFGNEQDTW